MFANNIVNKQLFYDDPTAITKLYVYLDSKLKDFNKQYYLLFNKINPLNKMKPKEKIFVKKLENSFCFSINPIGLSQPIVRWFYGQSRKKFFSKFFIIISHYYKICQSISDINKIYPNVLKSVCSMYYNLGETIICISNILLQTYGSNSKSVKIINTCKTHVSEGLQLLTINNK